MDTILYNIFLSFYKIAISLASLWNKKARLWIQGRKDIFEKLHYELRTPNSKLTWFHCSSLGEFEQGRPVLEKLKAAHPGTKILLTFFSPSGYEIRKDYKEADWVFYLPLDSKRNAKRFLDIVKPELAVFVKYDYWYHYLKECRQRNIPLLMVSAIFRKEQPFFQWYGTLHRKMLKCFSHFFVQDNESAELLSKVNINNVTVSGDTRFDRVTEIAENFKPLDEIKNFCGTSQVLVAGSTWPADEKIIKEAIAAFAELKIIIAPHEIHEEHLKQLKTIFPGSISYSQLSTPIRTGTDRHDAPSNFLIIDNIGMLSRLYHYATITYIGGGFDKGIHNTLEAAVYGKPVIFGPNYKKFKEATGLINSGGGISINSIAELEKELNHLLSEQKKSDEVSQRSFNFVQQNKGATQKILKVIQENRRFTK